MEDEFETALISARAAARCIYLTPRQINNILFSLYSQEVDAGGGNQSSFPHHPSTPSKEKEKKIVTLIIF